MAATSQRRRAVCPEPTASVSGSALSENFDKLMDLAADILLNPAFAPAEWDRLKTRAKAGLHSAADATRVPGAARRSTGWCSDRIRRRECRRRPPTLDAITPRGARRIPSHALRARPRGDRVRRRHLAGRRAQARRGEARRLEEGRRAEAGGSRSARRMGPREGLPDRPSRTRCRRRCSWARSR